jgi:hypothetical protein
MVIGIAGHLLLAKNRGLGRGIVVWSSILGVVVIASNTIWSPDVPDYLSYLSVALWLSAAGVGALIAVAAQRAGRGYALGMLAALVLLVALAPPAIHTRTRHGDRLTRIISERVLQKAQLKSILVVESDHWAAPLLYLRLAEGLRPDVAILPYGLANSSWYWRQLYSRHEDLEPIPLRGPGGRLGRVRRFLDANADRPVMFESLNTAMRLGRTVCPGGFLLASGKDCRAGRLPDDTPTTMLSNALQELGDGSPGTDGMIAAVAFGRGEALRRMGFLDAGFHAYMAGVPIDLRPKHTAFPTVNRKTGATPMRSFAQPSWRKSTALGDPGRNLFMASRMLWLAGDPRGSVAYIEAAVLTGLPEASLELRRLRDGFRSANRSDPNR